MTRKRRRPTPSSVWRRSSRIRGRRPTTRTSRQPQEMITGRREAIDKARERTKEKEDYRTAKTKTDKKKRRGVTGLRRPGRADHQALSRLSRQRSQRGAAARHVRRLGERGQNRAAARNRRRTKQPADGSAGGARPDTDAQRRRAPRGGRLPQDRRVDQSRSQVRRRRSVEAAHQTGRRR